MGFDATIIWIIAVGVAMLLAGLYLGYTLRGRDAIAREAQLQSEIGSVRDSFDEHKRRVTKHFERSSDLFRDLTRHYAALYTHLSQGARDFCKTTSPSLGAELRMLLADGEASAHADLHVANDYRSGAVAIGQPPGAPPPLHVRHTGETSLAASGKDPQWSSARGGVQTGAISGEIATGEAPAAAAPADDPTPVEVVSADEQPAARAKPARPNEGIGEWLARLDAREREQEQHFSSGYERTQRTENDAGARRRRGHVEADGAFDDRGAEPGAVEAEHGAPDGWDGRDLVDQSHHGSFREPADGVAEGRSTGSGRRGRKRGLRAA